MLRSHTPPRGCTSPPQTSLREPRPPRRTRAVPTRRPSIPLGALVSERQRRRGIRVRLCRPEITTNSSRPMTTRPQPWIRTQPRPLSRCRCQCRLRSRSPYQSRRPKLHTGPSRCPTPTRAHTASTPRVLHRLPPLPDSDSDSTVRSPRSEEQKQHLGSVMEEEVQIPLLLHCHPVTAKTRLEEGDKTASLRRRTIRLRNCPHANRACCRSSPGLAELIRFRLGLTRER